MNKKSHKNILVSGVLVTLSFLPGCALLNRGTETTVTESKVSEAVPMTGEVLVTMKGKPIVTTDTLEIEKEKVIKANPQIRQALAIMDPKPFERDLLEGLIVQKIAAEYIASQGIDQTVTYQTELKELCEAMKNMLNARYFNEMKKVVVTDKEVRDFYDAHKDKLRGVMTSLGGVMASAIEFDNESSARAFASKAKMPGGFKKAAQDSNLTANIKDFKLVNEQTPGINELLRDKILGIKTVPSVEMFDIDGKFYVVNATAKEEPKYVAYEQIKDRLKQDLEQNKRVELLQQEIDNLRQQYAVEVNEAYFKSAEPQQTKSSEPRGGVANATKQESSDAGLA